MRFYRGMMFIIVLWLTATGLACAADIAPSKSDAGDPGQKVLVLLKLSPEHFRPNTDYGGGYGDGEGRPARRRAAVRLAREQGLTLLTDWPMPLVGVDCFVMAVPADRSPREVAEQLSRDPGVEWSEPMNVFHVQGAEATHNDPLYLVQPAAREWRLAELHQIATGRNVRVAVIDSMIEQRHPDLLGQVQVSENFVSDRPDTPEQHGTGVAGIIAAKADNGIGIAGVAPNARLMALRACWQEAAPRVGTICDSLSLAKALDFAITHNAQIVNMSLSGPNDLLLSKLLDVALARGLTVVAAFDRNLPEGGFPASHHGVVAVLDEATGPPIPGVVIAPGRDVPTTQPGGRWFLVNGSSYAAAHVSGLFALMRERMTRSPATYALVTAQPAFAIDACATLLRVAGPCDCGCAHPREYLAANPH
jgi:subtilisin family serine protease